jgi:nicotinamidase-related amidase
VAFTEPRRRSTAHEEEINMTVDATPTPGKSLISPADHVLLLIDHQSQMAFATKSIDTTVLRTNVSLISNAARVFGVDTILTTVAAESFSGPIFNEITDNFPGMQIIDRTTMNTWEDGRITDRINSFGKKRLVMAGLWTGVCIVGPALSALDQGFEVYFITDACGDVSPEAHERAVARLLQAGARPMTSLQYLLELQRDWARLETYDSVMDVAKKFGGGYGLGVTYAKTMLGEHASEAGSVVPVG